MIYMVRRTITVFLAHVDPDRHDLNCFYMQQFHCVVASSQMMMNHITKRKRFKLFGQ